MLAITEVWLVVLVYLSKLIREIIEWYRAPAPTTSGKNANVWRSFSKKNPKPPSAIATTLLLSLPIAYTDNPFRFQYHA